MLEDSFLGSSIQNRPECHLRQFPCAVPVDLAAFVAAHDLIDKHLAKIVTLAAEHKFLSVRFGSFKEIEFRVSDNPDAFERHQGTHDICEI